MKSKITINSKNLLKAVSVAGSVVSDNPVIPLLSHLKVVAKDGLITLTGTNLETTVTTTTPATIEGEVTICIPFRLLVDILKSLPSASLELTIEKSVELVCGQSKYSLPIESADTFPKIETLKAKKSLTVNPEAFLKAIKTALRFVEKDDTFGNKENVSFYSKNGTSRVVGLSGNCVFLEEIGEVEEEFKMHMPNSVATHISSQPITEETVQLWYNDKLLQIVAKDTTITSIQAVAGPPDPDPVTPQGEAPHIVTFDRAELKTRLNRILNTAAAGAPIVKLETKESVAILTAEDKDWNRSGKEEMAISQNKANIIVGYNIKFLKNVLEALEEETVTLNMYGPTRVAVINEGNKRMLLTPCRVD